MKSLHDRTIDYYQNIDQWKIWKWSLVKWIGKEEWELKKSGLFLFKHQRIVTYEMLYQFLKSSSFRYILVIYHFKPEDFMYIVSPFLNLRNLRNLQNLCTIYIYMYECIFDISDIPNK